MHLKYMVKTYLWLKLVKKLGIAESLPAKLKKSKTEFWKNGLSRGLRSIKVFYNFSLRFATS